jgi:hypothetical protein
VGGPIDRPAAWLRGIIPAVRRLVISFVLAVVAGLGCGPKPGGGGPTAAGGPPVLRWAPADVTYAFLIQHGDGAIAAARDVVEALSIVEDGIELAEVEDRLRSFLGVSPLSADDLRSAGVDVAAGALVYSQGFSPTVVFRLADPAVMQNRIEAQRDRAGESAAVGNQIRDGVEVYTALGDRHLHTHWAIDGEWMWVHFEAVDEREPEGGWFDASRAARGALGRDPDFQWARAEGEKVQPGAPLIGLVRPARIAATIAALADDAEATACTGLVTWPRAVVTAGSGTIAEGHIVVDTGPGASALARLPVSVPAGWAARGEPALSVEWNVDLRALAAVTAPCGDLAEELTEVVGETGVRAGRGYLASFDADDFEGTGAAALDIVHRRMLDGMLDEIPGRRFLESKKKYGPIDGVRLDAKIFPAVDYAITADRAFAAMGDGRLAGLVGDGSSVPGPLAALELRPHALDEDTWTELLRQLGVRGDTRAARLRRWKLATLSLTLTGDLLHLSARGERP